MKKYLVLALSITGAILTAAGTVCLTWLSFEYENPASTKSGILPVFITVFGAIFMLAAVIIGFFNKES